LLASPLKKKRAGGQEEVEEEAEMERAVHRER